MDDVDTRETSRARRPSVTHLPPLDDPPPTVLEWLVQRFPGVGEPDWRSRMTRGLVVAADGSPLHPHSPYRAHLQVRYFREVRREPTVPFAEQVLFEDEHLVVADKPPFLPVTPAGPYVRECLLYRLERRLNADDLAPVHRLDRATSGLVVFSRRADERAAYAALFAERRVEKTYRAVAAVGQDRTPRRDRRWTVESRIESGTPFFRMREVAGPVNSRTEIEWIETWRAGSAIHGLFRLRPQTGKKHQLRVHMASLGFGILGDRVYPRLLPEAPDDFAEPLRLVAQQLRFEDPFTGLVRDFVSSYEVTASGPEGCASMRTTSIVRSSS